MSRLLLLLMLLLPLQVGAHSMKRIGDNSYKVYLNSAEYFLSNSLSFDAIFKVVVLDKEFKSIDSATWKSNFKNNIINVRSESNKKLKVMFKPSHEERKYYVCTQSIGARIPEKFGNSTRVCLRVQLFPTLSAE